MHAIEYLARVGLCYAFTFWICFCLFVTQPFLVGVTENG